MYHVYSFKDHQVIVNFPPLGRYNLSENGLGRIGIAYSGDLASMTTALDGSAIVNQHHSNSGSINLDIPQVGDANDYMDRWANYCKKASSKEFAEAEITIIDTATGKSIIATGVAPQKHSDITYDQDSQNRSWTLLAAEIEFQ